MNVKKGHRAAAALAVFALVGGAALSGCTTPEEEEKPVVCDTDAITTRNLKDLASFAAWVDEHNVKGMVGEAGWPGPAAERDSEQWNILADRWLTEVKKHDLPVYVWAAAPWWTGKEPISFYRGEDGDTNVTVADPQAALFERYLADGLPGGVNLAEGTFGAPINEPGAYSNGHPGEVGEAYTYPSLQTLTFLAQRGIPEARFAILWERLQPELNQPLDPTELNRIRQVYRDADRAGIKLVIDVHNFARYAEGDGGSREVLRVGDPGLPPSAFVDLWARISQELANEPALSGYDLMNEPYELPGGARSWEEMSRDAALAIRQVDQTKPIWVNGYNWSGAHVWATEHPRPWMPKETEPVVYQAHQYFDFDYSGYYRHSYARDNARIAQEMGFCTE